MKFKILRISEAIALYAVIILFVWISFFPTPIQRQFHIATKLFLGLLFISVVLKKRTLIFKTSDIPLWVFLITIFINVLFAQNRSIAFKAYLDLALPLFLIYYLISEGISTRLSFLVITISISSSLVALGGILESWFAVNPIYEYLIKNPYYERYITGFVRPMSTQYNPAPLGSYLLASLPFNFILFKGAKPLWRILGAVGIVLNTVVLILTFSRGAFLGLIAIIIFYLFMQRKYIPVAAFSTILVIFVFLSSLFPYPFNRFSRDYLIAGKGTATFSDYRKDRYLMTGRIFREHPLVGLGFQHFRIRFYEYYPRQKKDVPYENMIADNMYLTVLAETGAIGFLGFLMLVISLFKKVRRKLQVSSNAPEEKRRLLLLSAGFIGLLVNISGYELFYWPNPYIYFCLFIGLIEATYRRIEA